MTKLMTIGDYEVRIGTLEEDLEAEKELLEMAETEHDDAASRIVYAEKEIKRLEYVLLANREALDRLKRA